MSGLQLRSMAPKVARRLAESAEAVCRHYLFNGCRTGRYWHVGDVMNSPGQSLYVRLSGSRSGKWVDAATGEHGDLLDLIILNQHLPSLKDALDEACRFLALAPQHLAEPGPLRPRWQSPAPAARLFASAGPITATIAETYLRMRGIS